MTDTATNLRRKMNNAGDLKGVVRTMKALAAASITQYEKSVLALADYYRTVELGLSASFRVNSASYPLISKTNSLQPETEVDVMGAIVFGSDQGLVGQFNEDIAEFSLSTLTKLPGQAIIWPVGERIKARLEDHLANEKMNMTAGYPVPANVAGISSLIAQLVEQIELANEKNRLTGSIYVFHNRPKSGALYEPVSQRLLPLDQRWLARLALVEWPNKNQAEIFSPISRAPNSVVSALIREYLFISIFRACAESLASENASRLAAMQRAEKNIDELQEKLGHEFHRLRQSAIDEELFDVVAGYELLAHKR